MTEQQSNSNIAQHPRKWSSSLKGESSWRIFKIMSEFVEGFETMNKIGPCISIFGSARTKPGTPYYQLSVDLAKALVADGYGVITGGGPGIMEAANKGAREVNGKSVGLNIDLPHEQSHNPYIDSDKLINHRYFFVRKVMFVKYGQAFIFLPGGFGTLDELFECLTLIQTKKISKVPVILMGSEFWEGMMDWIKAVLLEQEGNISPKDIDLFQITDDIPEVLKIINEFEGTLEPNF